MKRMWTVAAAAGMVLGTAVPALANETGDEEFQPATNPNNCAEVEGTWWDNGEQGNRRVSTCAVGAEGWLEEGVPASHPRQAWTVDVWHPGGLTVYTFAPGNGTETHTVEVVEAGGDPAVVACWNHQARAVQDFQDNPLCVPAG
ncbi:hypothetical protein [Ornithinicoccus halotolerans]|uniref:hypothetical protein n=1 Tax=Ornithinicoccus halotolerans TaxID=1748220 RepID=UPI0012950C94|nr:hypothetical protein [Ornithinicoccus halotolerans]